MCSPALCWEVSERGRPGCLASLLLGHCVSAVLGEMYFVITHISKNLSIVPAQQGLLLLLPFKQEKLIHLPKEQDRWVCLEGGEPC